MKSVFLHQEKNVNCGFEGCLYENTEISQIFPEQIKEKLIDSEGTSELVSEFKNADDLVSTGFDDSVLLNIFRLDDVIKNHPNWRVGEAFAEFHLETQFQARFYYNELRDARNVFGNKTGADLVGFIELDGDTVFLFGEVKTSNEDSSPPNVLYSRRDKKGRVHKGMIDQLEDLSKMVRERDVLVTYLGHKTKHLPKDNPFRVDFIKSLDTYIKSSKEKFQLIGVLIRDTKENVKDIEARYKALIKNIQVIGLKMLALYIPVKMEDWNKLIG